MFHRCIASLTLLGFLAGQLAAAPHAHGAASPAQQRRHNARPHVHVGWAHAHVHRHPHAHEGDRSPQASNVGRSGKIGTVSDDHDADAVYLAGGASSLAAPRDRHESGTTCPMELAGLDSTADCSPDQRPSAAFPLHPPDSGTPGGRLFLKLRQLRI